MEDDAGEMQSSGRTSEEGRVKPSRKTVPTETSWADGEVESPRVARTQSLSLDGGDGRSEEEEEEEERDAEGNNNNNCNGGGGQRRTGGRRASAVDIFRRNFGVSESSPPPRPTTSGQMQHENREKPVNGDVASGWESDGGACEKSARHTGGAEVENEPPSTSDVQGVENISVPGVCRRKHDSDVNAVGLNECFSVKEHVYCTVYCIANDSHRKDVGSYDGTVPPEVLLGTGRDPGRTPEPGLYTMGDLVDPLWDVAHRLSTEHAGADTALQHCWVCLEEKSSAPLPCCRKAVCDECLKTYISSQVRVAKARVSCPIPECSGSLEDALVLSHLTSEDVAKYHYFSELSQLDSSTKPCPQCSQFTSLKKHNPNRSEHKYKVECSNCRLVWCFKCHAPWHIGLKCREYRKGDKLLRTWASVVEHGQRNAQKCPQCKIHIQRTEGCDHMTCTQCNTNFCYRCGERYRHLRFFGDHTSNLSVFGCKCRYLPDKPHLRRLIRGSVCGIKVLIAPVVLVLVVVLGALAVVIGLLVFPIYYVCKRRKKQPAQGSGRWI